MEKFLSKFFVQVIFKQYLDFKGKASRKQYWFFTLISFVLYMLIPSLVFIFSAIIGKDEYISTIVSYVCLVVLLLPFIAITTRRLNDSGRSGLLQFIFYAPLVMTALSILLLIYKIRFLADINRIMEDTAIAVIAVFAVVFALISIIGMLILIIFLILPSKNKEHNIPNNKIPNNNASDDKKQLKEKSNINEVGIDIEEYERLLK